MYIDIKVYIVQVQTQQWDRKCPYVREINVHGKTHVVIVTVGGIRKQTYIHKTDKEIYRTLEE